MPMWALSRTDTSPTETLTSPFCCELFAANAGTAIAQAASAAASHAETSLFVRVILPPFAGGDARLQSCLWQTGGYLPPPQKSKPWLREPEIERRGRRSSRRRRSAKDTQQRRQAPPRGDSRRRRRLLSRGAAVASGVWFGPWAAGFLSQASRARAPSPAWRFCGCGRGGLSRLRSWAPP